MIAQHKPVTQMNLVTNTAKILAVKIKIKLPATAQEIMQMNINAVSLESVKLYKTAPPPANVLPDTVAATALVIMLIKRYAAITTTLIARNSTLALTKANLSA